MSIIKNNTVENEIYNVFDQRMERFEEFKKEDAYFYFQEVDSLDGAWVHTKNARKLMLTTYNYLGLLGDERIDEAAKNAIEKYGSGTHGVRVFGGTLSIHSQLEKKIAEFTGREDAMTFSSGFMTNVSTISTLVGRKDWVISDKLNHASIIDGCILSQAQFKRFKHNDMSDLEKVLRQAPENCTKLVVADAVFSMDGDIFNLPDAVELCRKYNALLMIDEAHSVGVIGETAHGIEEHFGIPGVIDIKMGTLSKAIPAIGGYIAGKERLINYMRHTARGSVFSAALPPPVVAAALKAFEIIEEEGNQLRKVLNTNVKYFIENLKKMGFNTGLTETPIVPIMLGEDSKAVHMTRICQENNIFILPVLTPAVAPGTARLRVNVTAKHTIEEIDYVLEVIARGGKQLGII